jgi:hypothetical protein
MQCPNLTVNGCAHFTSLRALTDLRVQYTSSSSVDAQEDEDGVSKTESIQFSRPRGFEIQSKIWINSRVRAAAWLQRGASIAATATVACCCQVPIKLAVLCLDTAAQTKWPARTISDV